LQFPNTAETVLSLGEGSKTEIIRRLKKKKTDKLLGPDTTRFM